MTDLTYYNDDPRYELMATIIDHSNVFGGDAEHLKDDYMEILRLCYTYSIGHKWSAEHLAEAIVSYLFGQWGHENFEPYAREYWNPTPEPERPLKRLTYVDDLLREIEN